jgi:GNAT superfamily N-acetyltransferase
VPVTSLAADDGEELEDGARPTTPAGDNLVIDHARAEAAAFGALVAAAGGVVSQDDDHGLHLTDTGSATPFGNVAVLTRPAGGDVGAVVAALGSFYRRRPGGPFMVFSPWPTGDWTAHGFHRVGHPPLMFRPPAPVDEAADGLEVVRVADADTLAALEQTLVEAYPVPELQPWRRGAYLRPGVLDTEWRFFLGRLEGRPVATAGAFVTDEVTLVELVSTRPEARGRGFGSALTAAATGVVPDRPAVLIASDDGRRAYEGLGYRPLLRYTLWLGTR